VSQKLVDRSPDLKRLRDEGFDLQIIGKGTHLRVGSIPFVNAERQIKTGYLVSTLEFEQNNVRKPQEHTAWFGGGTPCDKNGTPLTIIINSNRVTPVEDAEVDVQFSTKPTDGKGYPDYYAKITTYVKIMMHEAQAIDPTVTAQVFPVIVADDDDSLFKYYDTSSSRAGITALSSKLAKRVAIIGLGGTGAYILDQVAKTYAREIHLFDDDEFSQHTAFRSPGALGIDELKPGMKKVEYYQGLYSKFRSGVIAHPYRITTSNLDELSGMQFVFLCLDTGELKDSIMHSLEHAGVAFIDVGMGVHWKLGAIHGTLRVTTSTPQKRDHIRGNHRVSFAPAVSPNDYSRNIQVADLNALNAILAVIKWKKLCGFYHDLKNENHSTYVIEMNKLSSEDQ
jgi:hypothetical protein